MYKIPITFEFIQKNLITIMRSLILFVNHNFYTDFFLLHIYIKYEENPMQKIFRFSKEKNQFNHIYGFFFWDI
jgi:hypothetical protein